MQAQPPLPILQEEGVTVTHNILSIDGKVYQISTINSIDIGREQRSSAVPWNCALAGSFAALFLLLASITPGLISALWLLGSGLLVVLAVRGWQQSTNSLAWALVLTTNNGEVKALRSRTASFLIRVRDAVSSVM